MKVQTFADLIAGIRALRQRLAECLSQCSTHAERLQAQWLLAYLAEHESKLAKIVEGFEKRADPKALNTWVYDYLQHEPIDPHRSCDAPYSSTTVEEICQSVFDLPDQVTGVYRYLLGRAEIPEARELLE